LLPSIFLFTRVSTWPTRIRRGIRRRDKDVHLVREVLSNSLLEKRVVVFTG